MLFFKLFKKTTPSKNSDDENAHDLEWRNRYLTARLNYLKNKIEKKGGYVGSIENHPEDLEAKNQSLKAQSQDLETQLKSL